MMRCNEKLWREKAHLKVLETLKARSIPSHWIFQKILDQTRSKDFKVANVWRCKFSVKRLSTSSKTDTQHPHQTHLHDHLWKTSVPSFRRSACEKRKVVWIFLLNFQSHSPPFESQKSAPNENNNIFILQPISLSLSTRKLCSNAKNKKSSLRSALSSQSSIKSQAVNWFAKIESRGIFLWRFSNSIAFEEAAQENKIEKFPVRKFILKFSVKFRAISWGNTANS